MDLYFSDSSSSSSGATAPGGGGCSSDEEVCLAINRPKKKAGRKIFKETRHPIYRGVRRRNGNKWVCEVRQPNKKTRIWLGTYPTPEMAARAHDVAALALRGKSACLNFADSVWMLPVPQSGESSEIRRVAGAAAEMFRPEEFGGSCRSVAEDEREERWVELGESNEVFIDEEEIFEMPRIIAEMAQGLLLSPPSVEGQLNCLEFDYNVSLWSY